MIRASSSSSSVAASRRRLATTVAILSVRLLDERDSPALSRANQPCFWPSLMAPVADQRAAGHPGHRQLDDRAGRWPPCTGRQPHRGQLVGVAGAAALDQRAPPLANLAAQEPGPASASPRAAQPRRPLLAQSLATCGIRAAGVAGRGE